MLAYAGFGNHVQDADGGGGGKRKEVGRRSIDGPH